MEKKTSKHSPFPWVVHEGTWTIRSKRLVIATFQLPYGSKNAFDEALANAYLMADAPGMLDLLKEIYFYTDMVNGEYPGLAKQAKKFISKRKETL